MLFGSVPWPPRKPRSSTSTQSARQNTAAPMAAIRASRGAERAALTQNAAPAAARAPGVQASRADAERRSRRRERQGGDQVHREPVGRGEVAEARDDHLE